MHRQTRTTALVPALAGLGALLALACGSATHAAEGAAQGRREAVDRGGLSYRLHCASCHGESGTGDGPMAELLKVMPADLTMLAQDQGDEFPANRVYRAIDGREEVRGHGPRGMPVWGIGFQDLGRDHDQEEEIRARIRDLVTYIESLQAPPLSHPGG